MRSEVASRPARRMLMTARSFHWDAQTALMACHAASLCSSPRLGRPAPAQSDKSIMASLVPEQRVAVSRWCCCLQLERGTTMYCPFARTDQSWQNAVVTDLRRLVAEVLVPTLECITSAFGGMRIYLQPDSCSQLCASCDWQAWPA